MNMSQEPRENIGVRRGIFRTKFLIFPAFQLRLIGANLILMLLISFVVWYRVEQVFDSLQPMAGISSKEVELYHKILDYQASESRIALLLSLLAGVAGSVLATLVISHKFSGP